MCVCPGYHHTVKKGGISHPESVDSGIGESVDEQIERVSEQEEGDFGASLVIGGLLIIPILIVVSITVFLRLRKRGGYSTEGATST